MASFRIVSSLYLEPCWLHFVSPDDKRQLVQGQEVVECLTRKHVAGAAAEVLDEPGRRTFRIELKLGRGRNGVRI